VKRHREKGESWVSPGLITPLMCVGCVWLRQGFAKCSSAWARRDTRTCDCVSYGQHSRRATMIKGEAKTSACINIDLETTYIM